MYWGVPMIMSCDIVDSPGLRYSRQPKIGDVDAASLGQQDIGWFDVAVKNALLVGVIEGIGNGRGNAPYFVVWAASPDPSDL